MTPLDSVHRRGLRARPVERPRSLELGHELRGFRPHAPPGSLPERHTRCPGSKKFLHRWCHGQGLPQDISSPRKTAEARAQAASRLLRPKTIGVFRQPLLVGRERRQSSPSSSCWLPSCIQSSSLRSSGAGMRHRPPADQPEFLPPASNRIHLPSGAASRRRGHPEARRCICAVDLPEESSATKLVPVTDRHSPGRSAASHPKRAVKHASTHD